MTNVSSNRSKVFKALDIAAMDALMAGIMAFILAILYSWASKEGTPFSQKSWTEPLVLGLTWRAVVLGGLVGGITGSIIRPSWGPFMPAIGNVFFVSILEVKPDFPSVVFCLGLALIYALVSFCHNMSAKPVQVKQGQTSGEQAPSDSNIPSAPSREIHDPSAPKDTDS